MQREESCPRSCFRILDYSCVRVQDRRDAVDLDTNLMEHTKEGEGNQPVVKLTLISPGFQHMNHIPYVIKSMGSSQWVELRVFRMQDSGLLHSHLESLIVALLQLPRMQKTDENKPCELNLRNNAITDTVLHNVLNATRKKVVDTAVAKLVLSDNQLSDDCMKYILGMFWNVKELHLSGNTKITAAGWDAIYSEKGVNRRGQKKHYFKFTELLRKLSLLNLDRTSFDRNGAQSIQKCVETRTGAISLEVWIRGTCGGPNQNFQTLVEFAIRRTNLLSLKHDLQVGIGHLLPDRIQQHEMIFARLYFNGWANFKDAIVVENYDICATYTIADVAICVRERVKSVVEHLLTGGAVLDEKKQRDLRSYIKLLTEPVRNQRLRTNDFAVDWPCTLVAENKFTGETVRRASSGVLIGAPKTGWSFTIDVCLYVNYKVGDKRGGHSL